MEMSVCSLIWTVAIICFAAAMSLPYIKDFLKRHSAPNWIVLLPIFLGSLLALALSQSEVEMQVVSCHGAEELAAAPDDEAPPVYACVLPSMLTD